MEIFSVCQSGYFPGDSCTPSSYVYEIQKYAEIHQRHVIKIGLKDLSVNSNQVVFMMIFSIVKKLFN